jgi:signal transduction histidine kinase
VSDNRTVAEPGQQEDQLRTELEAANRRVAELYKMASLGRLLAGVVHEINTPISSILTDNEVISRSLEKLAVMLSGEDFARSNAKALEIIDTLRNLASVDKLACERISSVIRGLRTYSRADVADLRKVDLHEILTNAIKLSCCEYRRRVRVETDFCDLNEVECYPHLLSQVFLNILVNAGQAIEGEGTVTVRTRVDGDRFEVSISDTGPGIAPEHRNRIFSPGFTTKPLGVGTGLGLSISRKIVVEAHGGAIDFDSAPGKGTTFHVRIPIRQTKNAKPSGAFPCAEE